MSPELEEFKAQEEAARKDPYIDIVGLPSPLRKYNRLMPTKTNKDLAVLLLLFPIWLGIVLPLGISSHLILRVLRLLKISKPPPRSPIDSGHQAPETLTPRADRKYDIVVLGVTGFTGRLAARHLAKRYGVNGANGVKWAIAGRSQTKLDATKKSLAEELKLPELVEKIDTILVDTMDPTTMPALVKDTRVVATTAGPFQLHGNTVIEFCAKYGTHYVDITGEVGWVKAMMVQWGEKAKKTGAKIIPFCGHDSIPWDLTVYKLNNLLKEKFQDDLEAVKVWDEIIGDAPGGTLDTVTLALEGTEVRAPRVKVDPFLQLANGSKSSHSTTDDLPLFIDPFFAGRWSGPFVMAIVNSKIVRWTHAIRQQGAKKLSYREVMIHRDWKTAVWYYLELIMRNSFLLSPLTKRFARSFGLLPIPGQGPSYEKMEKTNYLVVTAEGLSTNLNRVESTLYFPQDAGCLETSKMMVESGLALAVSEKKGGKELPSGQQGGFWPPAAALGDVLLDRLIDVGAEYQVRTVERPVPKDKKEAITQEDEKPKDKDL